MLLSHIGENLVATRPDNFNVVKTAKRWESTPAPDDAKEYFDNCRTLIGTLIKGDWLKDNSDIALRKSYYRKFKFESPEDLTPLLEKDRDSFIEAASLNLWLYQNRRFREKLRECISSRSPEYGKFLEYDHRIEAISKAIPEWFFGDEGDEGVSVNHIADPLLQQFYKIEHLSKRIETMSATIEENKELFSMDLATNKRLINTLISEFRMAIWAIVGAYSLTKIISLF